MCFAPRSCAGSLADGGLRVTEMGKKADWRVPPSFQGLTLEVTLATSSPSLVRFDPTARTYCQSAASESWDEKSRRLVNSHDVRPTSSPPFPFELEHGPSQCTSLKAPAAARWVRLAEIQFEPFCSLFLPGGTDFCPNELFL